MLQNMLQAVTELSYLKQGVALIRGWKLLRHF
jgi:hypothetical protein